MLFVKMIEFLLAITLLLSILGVWSGMSSMMSSKSKMMDRAFGVKTTWTCLLVTLIVGGVLYWMGVL